MKRMKRSKTLQPVMKSLSKHNSDVVTAARMLNHLREGRDARLKKVRRIAAAIRAGQYETTFKWQIAIQRLIEEE